MKNDANNTSRQDVYSRITSQIVASLEQGVRPLGQTVERRTRCRTYYATAAVQRPALFRYQYPLALDECHRAKLCRSHLDDSPPGN
jgi:hypothetical protein